MLFPSQAQDSYFVFELLFFVHVCLASFESDCVYFVVLILHAVTGYAPALIYASLCSYQLCHQNKPTIQIREALA
jgi:hypothetical protein